MRRPYRFIVPLLLSVPAWACSSADSLPADSSNTGGDGNASGSSGGVSPTGGGTSAAAGAPSASGGRGALGSAGGRSGLGGSSGLSAAGGLGGTTGASGAGTGGSSGSGGRAGGSGAGGTSAGGTGGGGGGSALGASFFIGADITFAQSASDAAKTNLFQQMKARGFNYVRARIFVDPKAADGYDKTNGYAGLAQTIIWGKRIKDAGMGFLLDFHYSDNWADPGKQCVPIAWQGYTTIAQLATAVHDYTKGAITQLVAGGARPDMVQIGNEITPGMLIHRCDSGGQPTGNNPITGAISSWTNLGTLLKAGVAGVKEVDTGILLMLHIDRGNNLSTSQSFITNARNQGVEFDVFGESCYTAYQGQPSAWQSTFGSLATTFPTLKFVIAEYGPEQKAANDIMFNLPNERGIGTFNWEPATNGAWNNPNHALWSLSGNTYTAQPDLALYDQMKIDYASRL